MAKITKSITTEDVKEFAATLVKVSAKKGVGVISCNGSITPDQGARFNISWDEEEDL